MTEEQKKWIDNATYEDMLRKLRFGSSGDPMFVSGTEVCAYFFTTYEKIRSKVGDAGHTTESKRIGWG